MPKDRSFAHRIRQSNIDRQRNQAYFATRPAVSAPTPQEPKAGVWEILKGSYENHKTIWNLVTAVNALAALAAWWFL